MLRAEGKSANSGGSTSSNWIFMRKK
jgi:hypothetical protein